MQRVSLSAAYTGLVVRRRIGGWDGEDGCMMPAPDWSVGAVHKVQTLHVICAESLLCRRGKAVSATVGYSWFPSAVVFSNFDIDIDQYSKLKIFGEYASSYFHTEESMKTWQYSKG